MLGLYLKQLMEAKKQVYEAMSKGDFSAVQESMEKYKKMEELLQKPIYTRIMSMSDDEFLSLIHILKTKGISIEENITKIDLISKFMNVESFINEKKYDFSQQDIIQVTCIENYPGKTTISIGNTGFPGQQVKYRGGDQVLISSELVDKLNISDGRVGGPGEIGKNDAEVIIGNCESAIRDFHESYKFILDGQEFIKYINFLEELNSMTADYIDLSSREYGRQTKIFSVESSTPSTNMLCNIDDIRKKLRGLIRTTDEQGESKFEEIRKNSSDISSALNNSEVQSTKMELNKNPKWFELLNEVYECESLDAMKKKATDDIPWNVAGNIKNEILNCLKCYVSRKELIKKLSSKVVLLYNSIIVKFGYPSILDGKLFSTQYSAYQSCLNDCERYNVDIDWFSILISLRNANVLKAIESDMKELEKLIQYLKKQIENQKKFDKMKSEANSGAKEQIPELPTFGAFDFESDESDIQPLGEYLSETRKSK